MLFHALTWLISTKSPLFGLLYVFAIVVICLVLPYVLGNMWAKRLRMPDFGWKIGLTLMTLLISCEIMGRAWNPEKGQFMVKLGVDLKGGSILIYEVDPQAAILSEKKGGAPNQQMLSAAADADSSFRMGDLIEALSRRINPSGTKEIVVRPYGDRQVEIIIPEIDPIEIEQIKKTISTAGVLQFRIVANTRDHEEVIALAKEQAKDVAKKRNRSVYSEKGKPDEKREPVALWARVAREKKTVQDVQPLKVNVSEFTVRDAATGDLVDIPPGTITGRDDDTNRLELAKYIRDRGIAEIDVLMATNDGYNVNGSHLGTVSRGFDEVATPCIHFNLKGDGVPLFSDLTGEFAPDGSFHRQLGIILDNDLLSAPNIQERITGQGRITGQFTQEEVDFLVNILQAGRLPVMLNPNPISEDFISPLLGQETIQQGRLAIAGSLLLVLLFMLVYYRLSGLIACAALLANLLFTLALIVSISATLTMPGLAGLALTIGMAVDANVLIYERIREELERGAALRMAIRNGFHRATVTIIDSNLTTVLTALILYAIGTDQLRGFAVTLTLGLITSMFTAVFCAHVAFDILERTRRMTQIKMFKILGVTRIDFMRQSIPAISVSIIIIVAGVVGLAIRGKDVLDIDFVGGTSVQLKLEKPQSTEDVRRIVSNKLREMNVQYTLTGMNLGAGGSTTDTFKVDSSISEVSHLQAAISDAFRSSGGPLKLATYSMKVGPLRPVSIPSPKPAPKATSETPTPKLPSGTDAAKSEAKPEKPASQPDAGAAKNKPETDAAATPVKGNGETGPAEKPKESAEKQPEKEAPASVLYDAALDFTYDINEMTLRGEIQDAAKELGVSLPDFELLNPESLGGSNPFKQWTLRISADPAATKKLLDHLANRFANKPVWPSSSEIGGQVAGRMQNTAIMAIVLSWLGIIAYVWFRFQRVAFGVAAVLALVHDVLVTLAAIALSTWLAKAFGFLLVEEFKVNLTIVAALLTIIGYSINDTIVIFDRIREIRGKSPQFTAELINLSVNQTLARTILTSFTVFMVVIVMYAVGGEGIHGFAYAMLVGTISGAYSTVYIASPALLWLIGTAKPNRSSPA